MKTAAQICPDTADSYRNQVHCLQQTVKDNSQMRFFNTIMAVIGWTVFVLAIFSALGLGSMHIHFGPLDFKLPFHLR
jgi:hypothetical protein